MCRYYFAHDITAGKDLKLQRLRAFHKMEGVGIFWSLLELLAETCVEEGTAPRMQIDEYLLCGLLGMSQCASAQRRVGSVIRDFGLFVVEQDEAGREFFYNRRLMERFHKDVILKGEMPEEEEQEPTEATPAKRSYNVTEEGRRRMAHGGKRGGAKSRKDKGSEAETLTNPYEDKGSDKGLKAETLTNPYEDKGSDKGSEAETLTNPYEDKGSEAETLTNPYEDKGSDKGSEAETLTNPYEDKGLDKGLEAQRTRVGSKRPKDKTLKDKNTLPPTPAGGFESESAKVKRDLEALPEGKERGLLSELLFPHSDAGSYARVWRALYAEELADAPAFAALPKLISGTFRDHATALWWALLPDPSDGSPRPAYRLASVEEARSVVERFRSVLRQARASDFFQTRPNVANLPWIVQLDNFAKIEAGNYRNPTPGTSPASAPPSTAAVNEAWHVSPSPAESSFYQTTEL